MRRIITLLLVLFVVQPAIGQINQDYYEELENLKTKSASKLQQHRNATLKSERVKNQTRQLPSNGKSNLNKKPLDSLVAQEWDDNLNDWKNALREVFTYDANENVSENIVSLWSTASSTWQIFQKDEYTFDVNDRLVEQVTSYQYVPGTWSLAQKVEFTYDANGNETLESRYAWDLGNSMWVNTYKYESTYDSNQNIILYEGFEWFPGPDQWFNSFKDELFYTGGVLTSELNSLWNYGTSQWDNNSQWFYTYSAGDLIEELQQEWDANTSSWLNLNRYNYTYNLNGSLDTEVLYIWNSSGMIWELKYKDEYQYDTNGNRTIGLYSEWLGSPGAWMYYWQDEFVFDLNFTLADIIYPYFYDEIDDITVINNMVIGYFGFQYNNPIWEDEEKMLFFYANYNNPLGIAEQPLADHLSVYPNPVTNELVLDSKIPIDEVSVYSILGQKVKDIKTDVKSISFSELKDGIYLLKITAAQQTVTRKIVKQ